MSVPKGLSISFEGKTALVTGAGKGIGRHLAIKLAEAGASVIAVSRTREDLDSLESLYPDKIKTLCLDLSIWKDTQEAICKIGPVDLLVNNVGVTDSEELKFLGDIDEDNVDRALNIGVKPIINVTKIIAEGMKKKGKGAVVNISSVLAINAAPKSSVFCASKGAVDSLTRAMAVEYGEHKIRVNSVNPSVVRTEKTERMGYFEAGNNFAEKILPRIPLRKFAGLDDLVGPVFFLLSDHAAMITGVSLPVDGGVLITFTT